MGRWSISEFTTYHWSLEEEIQMCHCHGFRGIGIWNQKLEDHQFDEYLDRLFESQLQVTSFSWIGGFTGSDGVSYLDAVKDAIAGIRRAAQIGAETVILYPGARHGHTSSHSQRLLTSALNELIPYALDYGVRLALEPMDQTHAPQWSIFETPEESIEYVLRYDPRSLGLVIDLFHVGMSAQVFDRLDEIRNHLALVQLADRKSRDQVSGNGTDQSRTMLFDGDVQILKWISRFEEIGYDQFYEIELFGPQLEHVSYEERLKRSREIANQIKTTLELQTKI